MERLKFIGKRLVYLVIMLFGVATLVFILTKLVPGDPVTANLSQRALGDPQIVAAYKAKYGLDQPIIVQYVYYMKNLLHFDLGTSIRTNNAVLSELARCYPATIELAVFAIILATLFGILFGVISAIKRNSIIDQIVRAISVTGVSLPSFWFALLVLYFFYYKLQILPGPGRLGNAFSAPQTVTGFFVIDSLLEGDIPKALDALRHLILPGTVLAAFTMGLITRTTRSNLLDVMSTDYIRTARAKGLSNVRLIIHHALGNALIPVLTVIGLGFGNLLGGMVLVETIFNWPGVGQFAYQSVLSNDYPSIIGVALLIALNYMIINTVVDILYGIIDPRVRCLIIALCVMGLISSICWLLSLCGHEKWEYNWMKNIEYFEDKGSNDRAENDKSYTSFELYKVINGDKSEFKAFSTHTITKIFIIFVIIGWMFCLAQAICENNNCVSVSCCFIFSILVFVLLMTIIFCCNSSLYSAVNTKISRM